MNKGGVTEDNLRFDIANNLKAIELTWEDWFKENNPKISSSQVDNNGLYPDFYRLPEKIREFFIKRWLHIIAARIIYISAIKQF